MPSGRLFQLEAGAAFRHQDLYLSLPGEVDSLGVNVDDGALRLQGPHAQQRWHGGVWDDWGVKSG